MTLRAIFSAWRAESGSVAIVAALAVTVMLGFAALAVDVSVLYVQKRQLQSATDLAALAATWPLANNPTASITTASATAIAKEAVKANLPKSTTSNVSVLVGFYCPDSTLNSSARFPAKTCVNSPNISVTQNNAARVTASLQSPFYFARIFSAATSTPITATATATRIDEAGIAAGTGVLNIDSSQSPFLNTILSGLLGGSINLSAAQYNGLLGTNINALDYLNALAIELNIKSGTYGDLLSTNATVTQIIQAAIDVLNKPGNISNITASIVESLVTLKADVVGSPSLNLGNLLDLGVWQSGSIGSNSATALQAALNVFQLVSLSAQVANGQHFVSIPQLSINIPGIANASVVASIIEPIQSPPFAFGPVGISVHTAQVRLQLGLQLLSGLDFSSVLGGSTATSLGLGSALVNLPVYVEVGSGDASLTNISCGLNPSQDATVTVSAKSAVANVYIGNVNPNPTADVSTPIAVTPATLVSVPLLLSITGQAQVSVGSGSATALTFTQAQIAKNTPQVVTSTNMLSNLLNTLGTKLKLSVNPSDGLLGPVLYLILQPLMPIIQTALLVLLQPLFAVLDSVVDALLAALGIKLGYMDVYATGVRCGVPVLVQ